MGSAQCPFMLRSCSLFCTGGTGRNLSSVLVCVVSASTDVCFPLLSGCRKYVKCPWFNRTGDQEQSLCFSSHVYWHTAQHWCCGLSGHMSAHHCGQDFFQQNFLLLRVRATFSQAGMSVGWCSLIQPLQPAWMLILRTPCRPWRKSQFWFRSYCLPSSTLPHPAPPYGPL